jgi:ppGpp synthetase/RelA/SpoT-type nucleotidyltranferase
MMTFEMALLNDFDRCVSRYEQLSNKLNTLMSEVIGSADVRIHSVTTRCKSRDSFERKINRVPEKYGDLSEITDLCGVRIITYFEDEVEKIANVIEREFSIDRAYSIDKRQSMDVDRFGYMSVHYVATFNEARSALAEYRRFAGLKFEVQIRSLLQHAWAEIEHDLQYKSVEAVPRVVRRRFARLAGLLEVADAEFAGIRDAIATYQSSVSQTISVAPETVHIDRDSLIAYVMKSEGVHAVDLKMAIALGVPLEDSPLNSLVLAVWLLHRVGISTIDQLEQVIHQKIVQLTGFYRNYIAGLDLKDKSKVFRGISIVYLSELLILARSSTSNRRAEVRGFS